MGLAPAISVKGLHVCVTDQPGEDGDPLGVFFELTGQEDSRG